MSAVVDSPVKPEAQPYLDAFAEDAREPKWLRDARRQGLDRFAREGFPSRRSENWRYLDLQQLAKKPLLPVVSGSHAEVPDELLCDAAKVRLFLLDGSCVSAVLAYDLPQGVWFGSMRRAIVARPDLVESAATNARAVAEQPFASLNVGFFVDGFVLDVPPGTALNYPIEIVHFASKSGSLHTRNIVNLGAGSRATILEVYAGSARYWRNDVAAWRLGEDASLTRVALVEESDEAVHLEQISATLAAKAKLDGFALLLGGGTVRHEANIAITGDNAECRYDGAFVVSGREEANIVTTIDHAAIGGTTRELIKGVAAGRGHGAFQGKIVVREGAQQTDAKQTSRNLILGRRAVIDTKPELEILADDVKCAHGASVGDLDEAALFYLRARGIPADEARRMLVEGFLREPVEGIADPAIREHLLRRLSVRLARLESE